MCYLEEDNSTLLQQVSHLTGGHFKKIGNFRKNHGKLLPLLISFFSIGQNLRKLMVPPIEDSVDFRATCFCHKKVIDIGYVCSVCLAGRLRLLIYLYPDFMFVVFCKFSPVCACCKYEFDVSRADLRL
jgi:transcription initiation factor TFIIH subunit 3